LNNSYVNIFDTLTLAPVDRIQKYEIEIILPKYFSPEYNQEFKTNILIHSHFNLSAEFDLALNHPFHSFGLLAMNLERQNSFYRLMSLLSLDMYCKTLWKGIFLIAVC